MLHAPSSQMVNRNASKHFVILGAGISGLSLGWFLKKKYGPNISLTLLEQSSRTGGWIQTVHHQGFLFEQGPRGCRPHGSGLDTLLLIQELGLEKDLIVNHQAAKKRFLFQNDRLRALPNHPLKLMTSPWLWKLLLPLFKEWSIPKSSLQDESIEDFISRRLSREIAEQLIDPLTSGIYAGDIRTLSMKSCFPTLHHWEHTHGSLTKGLFSSGNKRPHQNSFVEEVLKSSLFSFKGGMETITKILTEKLADQIVLNAVVKKIDFQPESIEITTSEKTYHADHLFSTVPAIALAPLLFPHDASLATLLENSSRTSVGVVNIGFHQSVLKQQGFGYLIPSKEKKGILGMVWDSCVFPQQNRSANETRLTVMIGGEHCPQFHSLTEEDLQKLALGALKEHLQIRIEPDALFIKRTPSAIPQYPVGHSEWVHTIEQRVKALSSKMTLLGTSFHGVSVNDCIRKAREVAIPDIT